MLGSISFGGKLVIMYKWDPERALELIERERITTIGGVPAMVWQLLESPSFDKTDISSVFVHRVRRGARATGARPTDRGAVPRPHAHERLGG